MFQSYILVFHCRFHFHVANGRGDFAVVNSVSELVKFRSSAQSSSFGKNKLSRSSSSTVELTKNQLQLRSSGFSSG